MKKRLILYYLFVVGVISSCVDGDLPNTNGMWQLKSIEDENGISHPVDTVYYSFQRQAVFSYTVLEENEIGQESAWVAYGYVEFPDSETLRIQMDKAYDYQAAFDKFPWGSMTAEYKIIRLKSKEMVLGYGDEIYSFTKF